MVGLFQLKARWERKRKRERGEREREKKAGKKWILEKGQCNEKKS